MQVDIQSVCEDPVMLAQQLTHIELVSYCVSATLLSNISIIVIIKVRNGPVQQTLDIPSNNGAMV